MTQAGQNVERWDAGARITSIALSSAPAEQVFIATTDGKIYLRTTTSL